MSLKLWFLLRVILRVLVQNCIWVSSFKLQHSVYCRNHPQPFLLVQYGHGVVSYAAVERQQSSVVALHSPAAAEQ